MIFRPTRATGSRTATRNEEWSWWCQEPGRSAGSSAPGASRPFQISRLACPIRPAGAGGACADLSISRTGLDHFRARPVDVDRFGAKVVAPEEYRSRARIFRQVEPEDLLKYGLIPEFVGRLPWWRRSRNSRRAGAQAHSHRPKNALVKQYQRPVRDGDIDLTLAEERSAPSPKGDRAQDRRRAAALDMESILLDPCSTFRLEGVEEVYLARGSRHGPALYIYADRSVGGHAGALLLNIEILAGERAAEWPRFVPAVRLRGLRIT